MVRRVRQRKAKQVVAMEMQVKNFASMPDDIMWEILSKLPMQMILRCRSVCKSWNELTRSDDFIKFHLHETNSKLPWLILQSRREAEMNTLCLFDAQEFKVKKIPLQRELWDLEIKCSCDGLLCLASGSGSDPVYIYNPITKEYEVLPSSQCPQHFSRYQFVFDTLSKKYKVVRVYKTEYSNETHFEILTFGERSWRQLIAPQDFYFLRTAVEWNGSLYWLTRNEGSIYYPILAFDISKEEFYSIPCPFGIQSFSFNCDLLLGEHLAVVEKFFHNEIMRIWKVIGNKAEGFSLSMEDVYYTHFREDLRYDPLMQLNGDTLLLNVHQLYKHGSGYKRDMLECFETRTGKLLKQKIKYVPRTFNAFQFRPTLVTPVARN